MLLSAPSDEEWGQSWIVPLGGIAELGYKFEWKNAQCTLSDEEGRDLSVVIHHGCPMVPREVGRAMIDRLEQRQIRLLRKAHLLKSMLMNPSIEMMQSIQQSTEMALMFDALPDEVLMRVIPDLSNLQSLDGNLLPWNRKKRRVQNRLSCTSFQVPTPSTGRRRSNKAMSKSCAWTCMQRLPRTCTTTRSTSTCRPLRPQATSKPSSAALLAERYQL